MIHMEQNNIISVEDLPHEWITVMLFEDQDSNLFTVLKLLLKRINHQKIPVEFIPIQMTSGDIFSRKREDGIMIFHPKQKNWGEIVLRIVNLDHNMYLYAYFLLPLIREYYTMRKGIGYRLFLRRVRADNEARNDYFERLAKCIESLGSLVASHHEIPFTHREIRFK